MNTKHVLSITIILLFISISFAFAAHHYGHGGMLSSWDMNEMDTNKDGILSFDEFSEGHTEQLRTGFDMIDADKDGVINDDEWNDFLRVHGVTKNK